MYFTLFIYKIFYSFVLTFFVRVSLFCVSLYCYRLTIRLFLVAHEEDVKDIQMMNVTERSTRQVCHDFEQEGFSVFLCFVFL